MILIILKDYKFFVYGYNIIWDFYFYCVNSVYVIVLWNG